MKIASNINLEQLTRGLIALLFAVVGITFLSQMTRADIELQPGEVKVTKTAKAVAGKINTWDIELNIEGRNSKKTSDIVLVMDRSGSMQGERMTNAKAAARNFVNTLLADGNTTNRIALVSFAGTSNQDVGFTMNRTTLTNAINGLVAVGGTHTQASIRDARTLINSSTADHKTIVLLSDGEPTYSYRLNNPNNYLIPYLGNEWQTSTAAPESAYLSSTAGTGRSMYWQYSAGRHYNHGNSAIAEAGFAKTAGHTIYTVALQAGTNGNSVLENMASPGNNYTSKPDELSIIFGEIAGKISAAAKNISIQDIVSPEFKIVNAGGGTTNGNTVDWQNVQLGSPDSNGNGIRKATKTIRIELADDFAGTENQYPTNASVSFNYTDADGQAQTKTANSPIVNPVLIHTEKVVVGNKAEADDEFDIAVTDENGANFGHKFTNSGTLTSNKVRETGNYTASETIIGGQYDVDYEYKVGDNTYLPGAVVGLSNDYQTLTDGQNLNNDIYVRVTNRAKVGSLTIEKKLGTCALSAPVETTDGTAFVFDVMNSNGYKFDPVTLYVTKDNCYTSQKLTLPQGNYIVTERSAEEYTTTFVVDGSDTVQTGKEAEITVGLAANLDRTVTFTNVFTKERTITVNKTWEGGKADQWTATFELWRDGAKLDGQDKTITGNGSASWKVPEADIYGTPYSYAVKEIAPTNYVATPDCTVDACAIGSSGSLTINNAYKSPKTEFVAVKKWVGGPAIHPAVTFQLMRDGVDFGEPVNLANGTTSHTWAGLDATDANGNVYTYTVKEVAIPEDYQMTQDGNTITNTYVSPKINVTANKVWIDGGANHPVVEFQLYQSGVAYGEPVALDGVTSYTWENVPKTDENGVDYVYTVKEITNLENYDKDEQGMTVTNTYKSPLRNVTVKKVWENGSTLHQPVNVELKRDGTVIETVTLSDDNSWTHTWSNLPVTDNNAVAYRYTVNETNVPDGFTAVVTEDENGLTITNTYTIPTNGEATANKVWVNGPEARPDVQFQLFRHVEGGTPVAVPGAEIKTLTSGTTSVTWTGLEKTDIDGKPYIFTVQEVGVPANYTKVEDGLTVTNTYVIPTDGSATATKLWVNGPASRPTIWFQLWRQIDGGAAEIVPGAEILELVNGVTEVSWGGLEKTDINGNEYTFSVREVNAEGVETVPTNYELGLSDNGLVIVNKYVSPKTSYTVEKIWRDNFPTHPNIQVQLYRNGEAFGEPITLSRGTTTYTWADLDQTDLEGNDYAYTVDEVTVPEGYIKHVDGNRITNTYIDPFEPGKGGSLPTGPKLADTGNSASVLILIGLTMILLGLGTIAQRLQEAKAIIKQ